MTTIWTNRLKKKPKTYVVEFSPLCFLISGGLNIVFGLNTDMIRPQILWAEKPTQQTPWRDCQFQVRHKNSACCVCRCAWLFLACVTLLLQRTPLGSWFTTMLERSNRRGRG